MASMIARDWKAQASGAGLSRVICLEANRQLSHLNQRDLTKIGVPDHEETLENERRYREEALKRRVRE